MPCIPTFKRVLNVFVLNQFGEKLDRTRRNTSASTSSFQDDLRGVTAPNVQIISTATAGEEHYSYFKSHDMESRLSILGHNDDSEEDTVPFSVTNPIVFSEDPITCSNEMLEFADDLVDIALTNIAESEDIMDASHIEDLLRWEQRLPRMSEMILDTDTPTVRLLKARAYLMAAGELLKQVVIAVEHAKFLSQRNSIPE